MARVDIRPFVLGWLKDVRNATAPDGGWRTLDEIRAGLQRQGIQASAPECRKVLAALTGEKALATRKACPGQMAAWRFTSEEEQREAIEHEACRIFAARNEDGVTPCDFTGYVSLTLETLDAVCRVQSFREKIGHEIVRARRKASGLPDEPKTPDAPKEGGS